MVKQKYKFTYTHTDDGKFPSSGIENERVEITMDDSTLDGLVDAFERFLRATGFSPNGSLEFVDGDWKLEDHDLDGELEEEEITFVETEDDTETPFEAGFVEQDLPPTKISNHVQTHDFGDNDSWIGPDASSVPDSGIPTPDFPNPPNMDAQLDDTGK